MSDIRISPEQLHDWYLMATKPLRYESFNIKARVPYSILTEEQKSIDIFISNKINEHLRGLNAIKRQRE